MYPFKSGNRLDGYIFIVVNVDDKHIPKNRRAPRVGVFCSVYSRQQDIPIQPVACLELVYLFQWYLRQNKCTHPLAVRSMNSCSPASDGHAWMGVSICCSGWAIEFNLRPRATQIPHSDDLYGAFALHFSLARPAKPPGSLAVPVWFAARPLWTSDGVIVDLLETFAGPMRGYIWNPTGPAKSPTAEHPQR